MLWGKADLHIHTTFSDGSASPEAVVAHAAAHTDLAVIAITDHNTIDGALAAARVAEAYGIEVIIGEEISTREGHLLALFINEPIAPRGSAAESIAAVHAQGGLCIPAHPYSPVMPSFGRRIARHPTVDGVEAFNASLWLPWNNTRAKRQALALGVASVGGSDSHQLATIGSGYTRFAGRTAIDLYAAIRAGQTEAGGARWGLQPNARLIGRLLLGLMRGRSWSAPAESQR